MARSVTIANLITRAKYRADAENVSHVSAAEWQIFVAEAFSEVHAMVAETGSREYETEYSITITGATSYSLPNGFLSAIGVEYADSAAATGRRRPLTRIMAAERWAYVGQTGAAYYYELTGASIALWPTPSTGTYYLTYVPQPTDYTTIADSTAVDTMCVAGEKFITVSAAIHALQKGEQSVQFLLSERERAREDIYVWAAGRTRDNNRRVGDAAYPYEDWP